MLPKIYRDASRLLLLAILLNDKVAVTANVSNSTTNSTVEGASDIPPNPFDKLAQVSCKDGSWPRCPDNGTMTCASGKVPATMEELQSYMDKLMSHHDNIKGALKDAHGKVSTEAQYWGGKAKDATGLSSGSTGRRLLVGSGGNISGLQHNSSAPTAAPTKATGKKNTDVGQDAGLALARMPAGMPVDFNMSSSPLWICLETTMHKPGPQFAQVPTLGDCVSGEKNTEIVCSDGSTLSSNLSPEIRAALLAGGHADAIIIGVAVFVLLCLGFCYYRCCRRKTTSSDMPDSRQQHEYSKIPESQANTGYGNPGYGYGYGYGGPQGYAGRNEQQLYRQQPAYGRQHAV